MRLFPKLGTSPPAGGEPFSSFYEHLSRGTSSKTSATRAGAVQPRSGGPTALQMPEILTQVLAALDGDTLACAAPLVCKQWAVASRCPLLWRPRLDERLLQGVAAAAQQHQRQRHHSQHQGPGLASLALLDRAVFGRNLLRNPRFLERANSRDGPAGTSAGISREHRRQAWVATVGDVGVGPAATMSWQAGAAAVAGLGPPPPAPLPYPATASAPSGGGLSWTWGLQALTGRGSSPPAQPGLGHGSGASDASSEAGPSGPGRQHAAGCLATGSSWGEVVQVVDLLQELVARGLPPAVAAAALDSGALALGLSVWVAAPPAAAAGKGCGSGGGGAAPAPAAARCQFAAALMLDDGVGLWRLNSFQTFVRRDSSHHFFSKRLAVEPGRWQRYAYLLPACPPGARRAVVLLRGRGPHTAQPRTGSGVRLASAELVFVRRADVAAFGADSCLAAWEGREVRGP